MGMCCGVLRVNLRKDGCLFHQSLLSHRGKGSESKERLQQGVCTIAGNECGKLTVEERRVSGEQKLAYLFSVGLFASLTDLASRFSGNTCWAWSLNE